MVPMASKKMDSRMVKISRAHAIPPSSRKASMGAAEPSRDRSGTANSASGEDGTTSDQPCGLSTEEPLGETASSTCARTVVSTTEIRIPPLTLRTISATVSSRPTTNVRVGQPKSSPPVPSCTGTVVWAASGMRRTNPAFTNPISAMNSPMPTTIAVLRESGTALNTAVRNPVTTRTTMITPAQITRPITCGHVSPGFVAIVTARNAFTPSPAAMPNGDLAHTPMRMVSTPATSAVMAATRSPPRVFPAPSGP